MSILGSLGSLLGGGQGDAAGGASLVSVAGQLIQQAGGVQGLTNLLQQHGMGDAVQSWVGTGANQEISSGQLGQALQNGGLSSVVNDAAGKLGVDPSQLLGQLAQVLPHAVDHATPDGQVPQGSGFDPSALIGLAGKLFGSKTA
ncbi:MAG: YidB family protein [Rhodanobacter sp.]